MNGRAAAQHAGRRRHPPPAPPPWGGAQQAPPSFRPPRPAPVRFGGSPLSMARLGPAGRLALEMAGVGENEVWLWKALGTEAGERGSEPLRAGAHQAAAHLH